MSAPHGLEYDVVFNGNKISSFDLDVDLDNPVEVFEEVSKLFKTDSSWFDAKILFRFCEHIYYAAASEYSDMLLKYQRCCFIEKFKMFCDLEKAKKKYHFKMKKEDLFPQNSRDKKIPRPQDPEMEKGGAAATHVAAAPFLKKGDDQRWAMMSTISTPMRS